MMPTWHDVDDLVMSRRTVTRLIYAHRAALKRNKRSTRRSHMPGVYEVRRMMKLDLSCPWLLLCQALTATQGLEELRKTKWFMYMRSRISP